MRAAIRPPLIEDTAMDYTDLVAALQKLADARAADFADAPSIVAGSGLVAFIACVAEAHVVQAGAAMELAPVRIGNRYVAEFRPAVGGFGVFVLARQH